MKINRIIALIMLTVSLLSVLSACSPAEAYVPAGFKKISHEGVGYTLYVPEAWINDISTGVATAYVSENDRSNISFMAFTIDDAIIQATVGTGTATDTELDPEETAADTADAAGTDTGVSNVPDNMIEPEQYWDYYSKEFEKTFSDMEYEENGENLIFSNKNLEAKRYVYTATVTGGEYKFMQIVAIHAGTVYIFTYTALEDSYQTHKEDVDKIIEHISIG